MKYCYIFDIDGTLANGSHREHHIKKSPKDWDTYFSLCLDDEPILPIVILLRTLHQAGQQIVYVSGRSDQVKELTERWLAWHGLPTGPLYMRPTGNYIDDQILKGQFLDQIKAEGYKPLMAFDDRNRVVKMWRERGIVCAQVAEGDF